MTSESGYREVAARVLGSVEGMFLSPKGVFVTGNIAHNGISLIGIVDKDGNWRNGNGSQQYCLSNYSLPNAPCFVRNLHELSGGSVFATGRSPEGGIAKFDPQGKLDKSFSAGIDNLRDNFTTISGSIVLNRDRLLAFGVFPGKAMETNVLISFDGKVLRPNVLADKGKIVQAGSLPNGKGIVLMEKEYTLSVYVIDGSGYIDQAATAKLNRLDLRERGKVSLSISPRGQIVFWGETRKTGILVFQEDLSLDAAATGAVSQSFPDHASPIPEVYFDSLLVWLADGKFMFCNCGDDRREHGIIFDLKTGVDLTLVHRFRTPLPDGYDHSEISAAVYLPETNEVMIAEKLLRRDNTGAMTRLGLVSLKP